MSIPNPPPAMDAPRLCAGLFAFDNVGPSPNGFDKEGPLLTPLTPPDTPVPTPCAEALGCAGFSGSTVFAGCAGSAVFSSTTIPAAFKRFFSSNFAISSGDIVRYFGLFSSEPFFLLEDDDDDDGIVFIDAASFCAFSFSTCARIAAINASV